MKIGRNGMLAVAMASLVMVVSAPIAGLAQSIGMSVKIPFDFNVGKQRMPAGTYVVEKKGDALSLRDSGGHNAVVLTNAADNPFPKGQTQLVFSRYWDNYYLAEARWTGYNNSARLIKDAKEIALASNTPAERVAIAANVR